MPIFDFFKRPKRLTVKTQTGQNWIFEKRRNLPPVSDALRAEAQHYQIILFEEFAKYYDVKGKRILEIGSDGGLNTARMLIEHGAAEVHACNLQDIFVRDHASDRISLHVGDAGQLDLGEQSFDAIYGIALLEHIPVYAPLVETVARLLAPGGVAYLHGDPLWTGPYGHHIYCGKPEDQSSDAKYRFNAPESHPIPDWAHLTMDEAAMSEFLVETGIPEGDVHEIVNFIYGHEMKSLGDFSNKKSALQVMAAFDAPFDYVPFVGVYEGETNEYYEKARAHYSDYDLRAKSLTLWLRHRTKA